MSAGDEGVSGDDVEGGERFSGAGEGVGAVSEEEGDESWRSEEGCVVERCPASYNCK